MPTPNGIITATEFMSAFKMSPEDTVNLVNETIKKAMNHVVMTVGFFKISIKPDHDVDLMIQLIREAGFTAARRTGCDMHESWDYIHVEVPRAPKV